MVAFLCHRLLKPQSFATPCCYTNVYGVSCRRKNLQAIRTCAATIQIRSLEEKAGKHSFNGERTSLRRYTSRKGFSMKKLAALRGMMVLLAVMGLLGARVEGQVAGLDSIKNQEELDKAIGALDAALFDAYNRCDLVKFSSF
jgi:hypothetical protein